MSSVDQLRNWVERATNSEWPAYYATKHGVPEILVFEHLVHSSCKALEQECKLALCPFCQQEKKDAAT